jgi:hypothetical protein
VEWSGYLNDNSESARIELSCDKEITAVFSPVLCVLATSVDPINCGLVTVETPPSTPEGCYLAGTEVIIEAVASKGYQFSHWSGDVTGSKNPVTIVMGPDKQINANFTPQTPFPWWWLAVGISVVVIVPLVYLRFIRKTAA